MIIGVDASKLGADKKTEAKAKELLDYLGRRGFLDLGQLLQ